MIAPTHTGTFCACHVSLMGESALDPFKHMLLSISRVKLFDKVNLQGTTMHGDQGFNDGECFDFVMSMALAVLTLLNESAPAFCFW